MTTEKKRGILQVIESGLVFFVSVYLFFPLALPLYREICLYRITLSQTQVRYWC